MDNSTDHAPVTRFAYLDSTTILPKGLASEGIYPTIYLRFKPQFANLCYKEIQDIITILRFDGSSNQYRLIVARA
uniref:Uncharacterized protein n=1 Tax=Oryza glumipatula TaxID=40148 RepID=A0A0D9Z838_9ORYZ